MPYIENVAAVDLVTGYHMPPKMDTVLIRIGETFEPYFPDTRFIFSEVYEFQFNDVDHGEHAITDEQADEIAAILKSCLKDNKDIIVHCFAGMCRSGAVAEAGIVLGFNQTRRPRQPNVLVKKKLFKSLGFEQYENTNT